MIVHTLKMCTLFWACFIIFLSYLTGVGHFFHAKCLGGCLVCVICNSNSIRSFIFKLRGGGWAGCFAIVILQMCSCCGCSVALPRGAVGWSAVCDCGIS